jgi:hypothetical protein
MFLLTLSIAANATRDEVMLKALENYKALCSGESYAVSQEEIAMSIRECSHSRAKREVESRTKETLD